MDVEVKDVVSYTSSGCDCCEDTEWHDYEVWIGGEYVTQFSYLEDALIHVLRLFKPDFEVTG